MTRNQDIPSSFGDDFISGDSAIINVTIGDGSGSSKDLSGSSVTFRLSVNRGGTILIEKTEADDINIVDAANGELEIVFEPSDTADLGTPNGRTYIYEIEVTDSSGTVSTVTIGGMKIKADI